MFRRVIVLVAVALASALCIESAAAAGAQHEPRQPRVVLFGDSLSDTGNVFAVTGQLNTPPYSELDEFRVPEYPYAISAGRFTNGFTWAEDAGREIGAWRSVRAALRTDRPGLNYAYGGARAGAPLIPNNARDLTEQVTTYLADVNGSADGDIIVMFIGANDVADAVRALAIDPTGATSVDGLLAGIGSISVNLGQLVAAGARTFVILNIPNVALVPALNPPLAPPGLSGIATCWTVLFNRGTPLPAGCPALPPGIPGLAAVVAGLNTQPTVAGETDRHVRFHQSNRGRSGTLRNHEHEGYLRDPERRAVSMRPAEQVLLLGRAASDTGRAPATGA